MKNKDGSKKANVNNENSSPKFGDIDDKIIEGIYGGRYFKRNDTNSKVKSSDESSHQMAKDGEDEGVTESSSPIKQSDEKRDVVSETYKDNLKGMLVMIRLLSRSSKITDDLVDRYAQIYEIDKSVIWTCVEYAMNDFDEYIHMIEHLV